MKTRSFLKALSIIVSLTVVIAGSIYFLLLPKNVGDKTTNILPNDLFGWKFPVAEFPATGSVDKSLAYSDIRDPGGVPQGLPVRLKIPVIGVNTAIEDAFITPDGRMDVPEGTVNVAWFALGPHPGRKGSAVIGGHFGISNGVPKVFYNLDKLKIGDKVYIEDDKGDTLAFIVRSTRTFDRNADPTTVFTSYDGLAHLNLITCEGIWNQVNDTYPERLVVFTDAIPSEGAVSVKPLLPSTALTLPEPTTTQVPISPIETVVAPGVVLSYIKNLYATPLDGSITSFLLISILFVTVKIIRKYVR